MDECETFDSPDCDSCGVEDLGRLFPERYIRINSTNILEDTQESLTGLLAENGSKTIALIQTDKTVSLVDRSLLNIVQSYNPHDQNVTGIKFFDNNTLYTSSLDGTMKLYDARSNKVEKQLDMKGEGNVCPITTFDLSSNKRIICAGTELVDEDSFLLFWDVKGDKLLGGYFECHSDDIACVKFSPYEADTVATAATDGLINVFDISQSTEDDALKYSLNAEDTINFLYWSTVKKKILCLTDVHSVQYWDVEESNPQCSFSRETISKTMKRKLPYECYIVPLTSDSVSENPLILGASGLEHISTNCLRTLKLNSKKGILEQHGMLVQEDSKLDSIVCGSLYNEEDDSFLTITENGCLSVWRNKDDISKNKQKKVEKRKSKTKSRKGPY